MAVEGLAEGSVRGLTKKVEPLHVNAVSLGAVYTGMFVHIPPKILGQLLVALKDMTTNSRRCLSHTP